MGLIKLALIKILLVGICYSKSDFQYQKSEEQLDLTTDACNDFYEYACGNWRLPYSLRSLKASDTLTAVKADNKRILLKYFQQRHDKQDRFESQLPTSFFSFISNVTMFYDSCTENHFTNNMPDSIHTYSDILKSVNAWPFTNVDSLSVKQSFQWENIAAELRRYGVQSFFHLLVQPNWQASEQPIFYITTPSSEFLKRNKNNTYDEATIFFYERYVKYLMLDLGLGVKKAKRVAKEVVDFEKQLMALIEEQELFMVLQEPQSLKTIQNSLSNVNITYYFKTLLKNLVSFEVSEEKLLIVADTLFLERLGYFMKTFTPEILTKYLLVRFLMHFEVHMHEYETYFDQNNHCLEQANKLMPLQLSALYLALQNTEPLEFLKSIQNNLEFKFEQLKLHFEGLLNSTNVFDREESVRISNLNKIRAMRLLLPNFEESSYTQTENSFKLSNNYDMNLLKISEDLTRQELLHVISKIENESKDLSSTSSFIKSYSFPYFHGPLDVNAYYRLKLNAIEIPLGILRLPFFDKYLPQPQIYGSFVYIIAHELLHGFDYDGLNYDKTGNVATNWGAKSIIDYGTKAKCYFSSRYKNAALTLNENIADSEGLRLAMETFLSNYSLSQVKEDDMRMFFISFAQTWCGSTAQDAGSLHSFHSDRVNNVVANFHEFTEAFKCKENSLLNSLEKCQIW